MRGLAAALILAAGMAQAEEMTFTPEATEACLAGTPPTRAFCVGAASEACMQQNPAGGTTIGMGFCVTQEWEYWDARLNAAYRALMASHEATDAEAAAAGDSAPPRAPALRAMQRAWIGWRDAACDYERAQWGGGTGQGPATGACLMRLTGAQSLELEERLAAEEGR